MKTIIKNLLLTTIILIAFTSISFAGNTVPFFYNLMPHEDSLAIVDSNVEVIKFDLWEEENKVYVNGEEVEIVNNYFEIDITDLHGKQEFIITNDNAEEVIITYYISNEDGLVENYKSKEFKNYDVYVTTIDNVKVIYTEKDSKTIEKVIECLETMPLNTKANLTEIKLLPTKSRGNVAGVTNYDKITIYGLSKYTDKEIENIIYHEVAHTWAYELIREKVLDFSYTDYKEVVLEDDNFVSNYSKKAIKKNNDYSEDFAESIAFFFMNTEEFIEEHPARAEFILSILEI